MTAFAMHTPGHTPACMTHVIGDAAFVGDTLFMPDWRHGARRFPGRRRAHALPLDPRVLALPPETRLFMCHDYGAERPRDPWETTVADERANNIHVHDGISEDEFVAMRTARDATLGMPKLIIPLVQVNMRAGQLPPGRRQRQALPQGAGGRPLNTAVHKEAPMDIRMPDRSLSVAPQIRPAEVAALAALGFRAVICNRPDGEGADQPRLREIERPRRRRGSRPPICRSSPAR